MIKSKGLNNWVSPLKKSINNVFGMIYILYNNIIINYISIIHQPSI